MQVTLNELVGQNKLKIRIKSAITNSSGHAFLFTGPGNIGKKSFARELAKGFLCSSPTAEGGCNVCENCKYFLAGTHPDYTELGTDSESKNIKVDEIRTSIIEDEIIAPHASRYKVYLINADLLNIEGQNALLKSIEEPPKNVVFILTASDKLKLLPTVLSRCEEFKVELYSEDEIITALKQRIDIEDYSDYKDISEDKLKFLATFAAGIIGNAFDLMLDKDFERLRGSVMDIMLELPTAGFTKLLYEDYHFFEENKDKIDQILLLMLWFLGDIAILIKDRQAVIKNADKHKVLLNFIEEHPRFSLAQVGNCADRINEFTRNAEVNANYECSIGNMLIKMNKEFK